MKLTTLIKFAFITASITLLPGIASAKTATSNNVAQAINPGVNSPNASYLQPFNLAFLAYQGYLKPQGIPSASALIFEYQIGNITTEDVVKAAITANKLPAEVLNDQSYLSALESQLTSFADDSSN